MKIVYNFFSMHSYCLCQMEYIRAVDEAPLEHK